MPGALVQVFFRAEQIQQRGFHKISLLPSGVWDAEPLILDFLIVVEDDIQV